MDYQKIDYLNDKRDFLWDLIMLFHPELKDRKEKVFNQLKMSTKYNWVTLHAYMGSKSRIDLAFQFDIKLSGPQPMEAFVEQETKDNWIAWQFIGGFPKVDERIDINALATFYDLPKPTAKQMYNYYYKD